MLTRFIVLAGAVAVSSVYFGSKASQFMEPQPLTAEPPATMRAAKPASVNLQASGTQGKVTIASDAGGQFVSTFRLNGRTVTGLVDTGATYVAINETTARKIGISGSQLNYVYDVNTANGTIKAAHVMLDRVEIGTLRVQEIEAFVLKDKALSGTLIGMSFLKKLTSFAVKDGALSLVN